MQQEMLSKALMQSKRTKYSHSGRCISGLSFCDTNEELEYILAVVSSLILPYPDMVRGHDANLMLIPLLQSPLQSPLQPSVAFPWKPLEYLIFCLCISVWRVESEPLCSRK